MDEMLKQLLEELGMSRAQFAKSINIDRSQVVKTINGTIPVSKRFFGEIMAADFIGADFKARFRDEYGKDAELSKHDEITGKFIAELKRLPAAGSGEYGALGDEVYVRAKSALQRGETVFVLSECSGSPADDALIAALKDTGSRSLKRICRAEPVLSEEWVENLFSIADFSCLGVQTYMTEQPLNGLFPYGVFSKSFAVAFDEDARCAVSDDEEVCAPLAAKYERESAYMSEAVLFIDDEAKTLMRSDEFNAGKNAVQLYNHFAPMGLIDYDTLADAANPELPAAVRDILVRSTVDEYNERIKNLGVSYYTSSAVKDFADTGVIAAITDRYIRPFSVEARIKMLKNLVDMIKRGKAKLIETDSLRFSGDVVLNKSSIDLCVCGRKSLISDLYCAHFYLRSDRIRGLDAFVGSLKKRLANSPHVMSEIGATYFIESLITRLSDDSAD